MATRKKGAPPSRQALERAYERAPGFLRGAGTKAHIFVALARRGYSQAEHDRGWELVHAVAGFTPASMTVLENLAKSALETLSPKDDELIDVTDAALEHEFPDQHAVLLEDLVKGESEQAAVTVTKYVSRWRRMSASADPTDRAAIAKLARRGIDEAHIAELERLLGQSRTVEGLEAAATAQAAAAAQQAAALTALYYWYTEWSKLARKEIKGKADLIALGLASRAKPKRTASQAQREDEDEREDDDEDDGTVEDDTPVVPVPIEV